ncbi:hypothetical protein HZA99_06195, partial [Candidatus Woesearchaeota archaeon]|nr:hypothetical protein [Candidatus Woesearchaeota archaeon]
MRRNQDFSQELDEFDILFMNSTVTQEYEALASRLRESNPKTLQDLLQDQKVKSCVAQGRSLGKYENLVDTIKRSEQGAKEYYLAIKNVQKIKEIMPEIEAGIMQYVEKGWEEETRKEA